MSSPTRRFPPCVAVARRAGAGAGLLGGREGDEHARAPPDRPGPTRASIARSRSGPRARPAAAAAPRTSSARAARRARAARAARARRRTPAIRSGGRYCNTIGNGCKGQKLDCGACPGDATCSGGATSPGICIGGPSCPAITCTSGGGAQYCGKIGDGCGRELDCGACAAGQICNGGLCVPANCTPLTCAIAGGGQYCGKIGDGCGGTLDCQGCSAPQTCGGADMHGRVRHAARRAARTASAASRWAASTAASSATTAAARIDCGTCDNGMACRPDHVCPSTGPGPCSEPAVPARQAGECTGSRHHDQRPGVRPGREEPALQRAALRAEHGARPDPDGRVVRPLRLADLRHAGGGGAERRRTGSSRS